MSNRSEKLVVKMILKSFFFPQLEKMKREMSQTIQEQFAIPSALFVAPKHRTATEVQLRIAASCKSIKNTLNNYVE